jgi:hypothetical protein
MDISSFIELFIFGLLIEKSIILKVHKIENFFGSDFEICTFS